MEIVGKLIEKLEQQSGDGRNGRWVKQEFIVETEGQYPRKVCIALWGDKAKEIENIAIGTPIKASVNVESREFNGRWYTDVKAWRIETSSNASPTDVPDFPGLDELPPDLPFDMGDNSEDIPF